MYQQAFDEMIENLLHLIFPNNCCLCGNHLMKQEKTLCINCEVNLPYTRFSNLSENAITKLFWGDNSVSEGFSLVYFNKGGKIQQLLHELKYKANTDVGIVLGELIGNELKKLNAKYDFIIPVPLHPKKEKLRGYNQALYIAKGINSVLKSSIDTELIIRTVFNESQTTKNRYNRFENTDTIFKCTNANIFNSKSILIVDDVITTGSTINGCINTIKKSNSKTIISVASIGISV